jgi:hypothetical protein
MCLTKQCRVDPDVRNNILMAGEKNYTSSAEENRRKPVHITGARPSGTRPGAILGSIIIRLFYKLPLSDQAQVTLQLRDSISDLVLIFLAGPPLPRGPKFFFTAVRTRFRQPCIQMQIAEKLRMRRTSKV